MARQNEKRDYLRRLPNEFYRGLSFVHWSMTIDGRKAGWLDRYAHREIREVMLHALARYRLGCPTYCLMRDHMHLLWVGLCADSDQRIAASFFRKYAGRILMRTNCAFQKQAYDNVLRGTRQGKRRCRATGLPYQREPFASRAGFQRKRLGIQRFDDAWVS